MLEHLVTEHRTFLLQLLVYSQPSPVAAIVKIQCMFCNLSEWTRFTNRQKGNNIKQDRKQSSSIAEYYTFI